MVLSPSDYRLPKPGMQLDPTSTGSYTRLAGMVITVALVAFAIKVALGQGVDVVNQVVGKLSGGRVSTDGSSPDVF